MQKAVEQIQRKLSGKTPSWLFRLPPSRLGTDEQLRRRIVLIRRQTGSAVVEADHIRKSLVPNKIPVHALDVRHADKMNVKRLIGAKAASRQIRGAFSQTP